MGIWGSEKFKEAMPLWIDAWDCAEASADDRNRLLQMGEATIERTLASLKRQLRRAGQSGTVPSHMREEVEVSLEHLDVSEPGHVQVDTVAHCGGSLSGQFAWTVTCTDMATGFVHCFAVWHKNVKQIIAGLQKFEGVAPFRIKSWRFDNGTEFLNHAVIDEFTTRREESERIKIYRSRSYKKNDQCYVEQKNGDVVRRHVGYGRLDSPELLSVLNSLYANHLNDLLNHFTPQAKRKSRKRVGGAVRRKHDKPRTPLARLSDWEGLRLDDRLRLEEQRQNLNPFSRKSQARALISRIQNFNSQKGAHSCRNAR